MKIAVIIIRILLGALFSFSAIAYFFQLFPQPEITGALKTFNDGLEASGYLLPLVKGTELVCGIALLIGRYLALAVVVLFPIVVNIVCVHILLAPDGIALALFILLGTLFLAFYKRASYKSLLAAK